MRGGGSIGWNSSMATSLVGRGSDVTDTLADWSDHKRLRLRHRPHSAHPQEPSALHRSSLWLTQILANTVEAPWNSVPSTYFISCTKKPSYTGTMSVTRTSSEHLGAYRNGLPVPTPIPIVISDLNVFLLQLFLPLYPFLTKLFSFSSFLFFSLPIG